MNGQQAGTKREIPVAEVVRLIDLVNYQEGSVVSRTIVNRSAGTVTLFAFDEGQGLSEHTAPFDALAHILEGEAEIVVSGRPLLAQAGGAVLMPANQPHALKAVTRFKMLLTMIRSA
jgi:quercetin dioxygenase-like cupin family protein